MLRLTIYHNIHLTRDQIYDLHQGEDVTTVGVSVPTWFLNKITSEPANEVFCKYYLKNPKKEIPIKIMADGYEITLPYREAKVYDPKNKITKEEDDLEDMYLKSIKEISCKNLLDPSDGGCGFLNYRELNKIKVRNKELDIMHYIVITKIENLIESIGN
jgi:hypothetical protein